MSRYRYGDSKTLVKKVDKASDTYTYTRARTHTQTIWIGLNNMSRYRYGDSKTLVKTVDKTKHGDVGQLNKH